MPRVSTETKESHVFKTNELCVNACYEDRQPLEVVIKEKKDEELPHEGIEEGQNQKSVITEKVAELSHKSSEKGDHTYSKSAGLEEKQTQKIVLTANTTELVYEDSHKKDKDIEEQHSDAMATDFDELKFLEE